MRFVIFGLKYDFPWGIETHKKSNLPNAENRLWGGHELQMRYFACPCRRDISINVCIFLCRIYSTNINSSTQDAVYLYVYALFCFLFLRSLFCKELHRVGIRPWRNWSSNPPFKCLCPSTIPGCGFVWATLQQHGGAITQPLMPVFDVL